MHMSANLLRDICCDSWHHGRANLLSLSSPSASPDPLHSLANMGCKMGIMSDKTLVCGPMVVCLWARGLLLRRTTSKDEGVREGALKGFYGLSTGDIEGT